ncbi:hypothetical protein [Burkholderia territorii]|uniref:Uncharacterized protein n=1 Tax=Burkholderia territorii TaxID=1503055 RepID=A0A6L3NL86_9BURK|nr:hypothetical protein [Burkholderia territorii]KAB0685362.1 hypothetical protein F7R13_04770 [Burkholderia territorii]MBM2771838.1 hypothetical protein [Burkholderia territorii]VWB65435.1 hypothetical protein BTE28158_03058 [Burkholderia territorii]
MTATVTKEQLDQALEAWEVAEEKSRLEQLNWGQLSASRQSLITSLRKTGHTLDEAQAQFNRYSEAHRAALVTAWADMDEKCAHYWSLHARFTAQQP